DGTTVVASNAGTPTARIPSANFLSLPSTGTYTIRAASGPGQFGNYSLSLNLQPTAACTYTVNPASVNVTPSGGQMFFDVVTQSGCPAVTAALGASSSHLSIVSNVGGRVTYSVQPNTAASSRVGTIVVNGNV